MIDSLALFASIVGFYMLCLACVLHFLWGSLRGVFAWRVSPYYAGLFALGLAWFLALGLRILPGLWAYYLDVPSTQALMLNGGLGGVAGVVGIVIITRQRWDWRIFSFTPVRMGVWEKVACALVIALLIAHAYRAAAPWLDHDETAVYGFAAKLIGEGYVRQDLGIDWRTSYLVESLDAPAIRLVRDTYLARALRFVNLLFVSLMLLAFMFWLCRKGLWAWLALASFLAIPESLAYLATSLKVDGTVFCLELAVLMVLTLSVETWRRKRALVDGEQISRLVFVGVLLAMISMGARQSGIYSTVLICGVWAYFMLRVRAAVPRKLIYGGGFVLVAALFAPKALFNIHTYGNPLYPFKGPWPMNMGAYKNALPGLQIQYNLQNFPPVVEQAYLVFHLALGIEAREWSKWLPPHIAEKIPHAPARGVSMNWLSPSMLAIFVIPFFATRVFGVAGLGLVFLFLFVSWSLGVQYSRVFIAGSTLPLLASGAIAAMDLGKAGDTVLRLMRLGVQSLLWLSAVVPLIYYLVRWVPMFPHTPAAFVSQAQRLQANVDLLTNTYGEKGLPGSAELRSISALLAAKDKPRVMAFTASGRVVHILFDHGKFSHTHVFDMDWVDPEKIARAWEANDCALINWHFAPAVQRRKSIVASFPQLEFTADGGQWELRCR